MRRLRQLGVSLLLAAVAAAIGAALFESPLTSLTFANRIADYRLIAGVPARSFLPAVPEHEAPNQAIALITIDEPSLAAPPQGLGAWPYPRSLYGRLLRRLTEAGARVAALDVDFLEASADPAQDAAFARGGAALPSVLGYTVTTTSRGIPGAEIPPPDLRATMHMGYTTIDTPGGFVISQPPDIAPMPPGFPGRRALSLALAAAQLYRGRAIDPRSIPLFEGGMLVAPFQVQGYVSTSGRVGAQLWNVRYIAQSLSLVDAMTMPLPAMRTFAHGRLVLIGATAQALQDFTTTITGQVPGVYVHARLIDQLLRGMYVRPAPDWLNLSLIVLLPLLLTALLLRVRALIAVVLGAGIIALYAVIAIALFAYDYYWLDLLHVAGAMLLAALAAIAVRVVSEAAGRRVVTEMFGRHVSPGVVAEIMRADDPSEALALKGKRAKVTVFYSDIRGFTAMSERMTAEAIYDQLNEYFEAMCEIIFSYGGYVDKFIGDCIMSVFSAPAQREDDAYRAVAAALDQQAVIAKLSARWQTEGKPPFTVGMGVNTGEVVLGNLGSAARMNYTVIGDEVNTAARLYNVALGGQIIISHSTYEEIKDRFAVRELEPVTVKNKSAPLRIYEVLARAGTPEALLNVEPGMAHRP